MQKIAILGAGNGGVSMGAYIALKGGHVNLYDKYANAIEAIQEKKGVNLKGVSLNGFASFHTVSTNVEEVIRDCEMIMVVTPAFAHKEIAQACAKCLVDGQMVVLHPGRTGGAMEFYKIVKEINPSIKVSIAEAQTLIYASRRTGPTEATIYGVKEKVSVAAIPHRDTKKVVAKLNAFYEQFVPAENVLETSLLNIGAIFHPTPSILNVARMECQEDFKYYHEGISPSVGKVLEEIDKERMAVANAFGVKTISTNQWLKEVYGVQSQDIYSTVQSNKVYADIVAPKSSATRYITEDVPMSLTPISELAKLANVETPVIDMMIKIASIMHNTDYRREGRTLERMGIQGMSQENLLKYVNGTDAYKEIEMIENVTYIQ
jgi:opine dehydrogenase